jgi:hypothetical protein
MSFIKSIFEEFYLGELIVFLSFAYIIYIVFLQSGLQWIVQQFKGAAQKETPVEALEAESATAAEEQPSED